MTRQEEELMLRVKGRLFDEMNRDRMACYEKIGYLKQALKFTEEKLRQYKTKEENADRIPQIIKVKGGHFHAN